MLQGWSFSDAMFVTKKNMANAVESFSKQLNDLSETLAVKKKKKKKNFLTINLIFVKISKWLNSYIEDAICFFFFFEEIRYVSLLTRTFMKQ